MESELVSAIIDTNVIVSAVLKPNSVPALIVSAGIGRKFQICCSDKILKEYHDVLGKGKFAFPASLVRRFLIDIERSGRIVKPARALQICSDKDDDKFLECAEAANALYVVTGNKKHFPPMHGRTKIVTPREFAMILISAGIL